ncbi:exodeoxyribonuclease VII small subunit [Corynebacterium bovis]|uniref:exodeoxyribonuclease VII small subunit n=1 Tax=Corynebacterium bovis TaxID=36808 RepID=UPI003138B245
MTGSTGQENRQTFRPVEELNYEQARDELVEVVKILELGQMSLDESLNYWERGETLAAYCETYLDGASSRIEQALARRDGRGGAGDTDGRGDTGAGDGGAARGDGTDDSEGTAPRDAN